MHVVHLIRQLLLLDSEQPLESVDRLLNLFLVPLQIRLLLMLQGRLESPKFFLVVNQVPKRM